jgi:hypothetical protein
MTVARGSDLGVTQEHELEDGDVLVAGCVDLGNVDLV